MFINDQLVIDLGRVHGAAAASVNLNTLGLTAGNTYDFDFFFAERHTSQSNLRISTSIPIHSSVPDGGSSLVLLGVALAGTGFCRGRGRQ